MLFKSQMAATIASSTTLHAEDNLQFQVGGGLAACLVCCRQLPHAWPRTLQPGSCTLHDCMMTQAGSRLHRCCLLCCSVWEALHSSSVLYVLPLPQVHPAPGPEEVNWQALWLNWRQRDIRGYITAPLWLFIVFFPIGIFTGALSQLDYVLCAGGQVGADCAACCLLARSGSGQGLRCCQPDEIRRWACCAEGAVLTEYDCGPGQSCKPKAGNACHCQLQPAVAWQRLTPHPPHPTPPHPPCLPAGPVLAGLLRAALRMGRHHEAAGDQPAALAAAHAVDQHGHDPPSLLPGAGEGIGSWGAAPGSGAGAGERSTARPGHGLACCGSVIALVCWA